MKVFKYLSNRKGIAEMYRIYKAVQDLKHYALLKYKGDWEEALNASFFHICSNYNPDKGELEHYAIKVVGTIYLSANSKELVNSEQTDLCIDLQSVKDYSIPGSQGGIDTEEDEDNDFERCLTEMLAVLLKDFKFFASLCTRERKGNYSQIFKKYSPSTINQVRTYLLEKYQKDVSRLYEFAKKSNMRDFGEDRYCKSLDKGVTFCGSINDIIIARKEPGYHVKVLYRLNIKDIIDDIIKLFYTDLEYGRAVIEGASIYVTLSGKIAYSETELRSLLERELVGSVLSRTSLRVVHYARGEFMLLSSTKDYHSEIQLPMFGKNFIVEFERVTVKEVV